jgi:hypothetical protein
VSAGAVVCLIKLTHVSPPLELVRVRIVGRCMVVALCGGLKPGVLDVCLLRGRCGGGSMIFHTIESMAVQYPVVGLDKGTLRLKGPLFGDICGRGECGRRLMITSPSSRRLRVAV